MVVSYDSYKHFKLYAPQFQHNAWLDPLNGGRQVIPVPDGVTTVVDPGLPRWLGDELAGFTPRVMGYYARRLGAAPGDAPTLMVSWTGPTKSLSSMGGSVLPGMISMSF